jgi:hypothetical protein
MQMQMQKAKYTAEFKAQFQCISSDQAKVFQPTHWRIVFF